MSYDLIAAKLDEIEAEMPRLGYWFDNPPTPVSCRFEDIAGEMRRVGYWDAADPNRNDYGRVVSPSFSCIYRKSFSLGRDKGYKRPACRQIPISASWRYASTTIILLFL